MLIPPFLCAGHSFSLLTKVPSFPCLSHLPSFRASKFLPFDVNHSFPSRLVVASLRGVFAPSLGIGLHHGRSSSRRRLLCCVATDLLRHLEGVSNENDGDTLVVVRRGKAVGFSDSRRSSFYPASPLSSSIARASIVLPLHCSSQQ